MRDRSWRRAQRERARNRARRHLRDKQWFSAPYRLWSDSEVEVVVSKNAITPHPCSAHCCGNPRKWFGDATMQELKADGWEKDQREDYEGRDHKGFDN